jgi:hypothetical protein
MTGICAKIPKIIPNQGLCSRYRKGNNTQLKITNNSFRFLVIFISKPVTSIGILHHPGSNVLYKNVIRLSSWILA